MAAAGFNRLPAGSSLSETRRTADRLGASAKVSGVLRHKALSFNFTGHASWIDEPRGSDHDSRMYDAYGGWQIDPRSNVELGKRALRWGKGYAWNPVAFLERAKDPSDPELAREGFVMATGSWVRSFEGPLLQTLALTAAVVPSRSMLYSDFGGDASNDRHATAAVNFMACPRHDFASSVRARESWPCLDWILTRLGSTSRSGDGPLMASGPVCGALLEAWRLRRWGCTSCGRS